MTPQPLRIDLADLNGRDAVGMANVATTSLRVNYSGVGIDPRSSSGSFQAVLKALKSGYTVPANLKGAAVLLTALEGQVVKCQVLGDSEPRMISIANLKTDIRSAAIPAQIAQTVNQTPSETRRARERTRRY